MLDALKKAFTGQAGALASFLALLIIATIALAIILGIPRIEQALLTDAEDFLKLNLTDKDKLTALKVEGRTLYIEGKLNDVEDVKQQLDQLSGMRKVVVRESHVREAIEMKLIQVSTENTEDIQAEKSQSEPESSLPTDDLISSVQTESRAAPYQSMELDQSSLTLRYDGPELVLTGHLVDQPTIDLVAGAINEAIPAFSNMALKVDGRGAFSSLSWLDRFLALVAGLPDDAQGVIKGSDRKGVWIEADKRQTLIHEKLPERPTATDSLEVGDVSVNEKGLAEENAVSPEEGKTLKTQPRLGSGSDRNGETPVDVLTETGPEFEQVKPSLERQSRLGDIETKSPVEHITRLNKKLATKRVFQTGRSEINAMLADELAELVDMLARHPDLLLRVVGNVDFDVDPRDGRYMGISRARAVIDYMRALGADSLRIFTEPLPSDYAFDERVQVVFYISE